MSWSCRCKLGRAPPKRHPLARHGARPNAHRLRRPTLGLIKLYSSFLMRVECSGRLCRKPSAGGSKWWSDVCESLVRTTQTSPLSRDSAPDREARPCRPMKGWIEEIAPFLMLGRATRPKLRLKSPWGLKVWLGGCPFCHPQGSRTTQEPASPYIGSYKALLALSHGGGAQ